MTLRWIDKRANPRPFCQAVLRPSGTSASCEMTCRSIPTRLPHSCETSDSTLSRSLILLSISAADRPCPFWSPLVFIIPSLSRIANGAGHLWNIWA